MRIVRLFIILKTCHKLLTILFCSTRLHCLIRICPDNVNALSDFVCTTSSNASSALAQRVSRCSLTVDYVLAFRYRQCRSQSGAAYAGFGADGFDSQQQQKWHKWSFFMELL